jgi:hypothetical protein
MQPGHQTSRQWLAGWRLAAQQRAAKRLNLPDMIAAAKQVMKEALNQVSAWSALAPKFCFQPGQF